MVKTDDYQRGRVGRQTGLCLFRNVLVLDVSGLSAKQLWRSCTRLEWPHTNVETTGPGTRRVWRRNFCQSQTAKGPKLNNGPFCLTLPEPEELLGIGRGACVSRQQALQSTSRNGGRGLGGGGGSIKCVARALVQPDGKACSCAAGVSGLGRCDLLAWKRLDKGPTPAYWKLGLICDFSVFPLRLGTLLPTNESPGHRRADTQTPTR